MNDVVCQSAQSIRLSVRLNSENSKVIVNFFVIFTARCTIVESAVLQFMSSVSLSVYLSVTLVDQEHTVHTGWKSWKLSARAISPTPSLFVAQRPSTYCQGNMDKILRRLEVGGKSGALERKSGNI